METAYFNNIRQQILSELSSAQREIYIAVAWFTNNDLFQVLCTKLRSRVKIELVIIDDFINNGDYGLDFQTFINLGGKLKYGFSDNPMHHKFAIIDNKTLINGSYNWTYYAESRNEENIVIFKNNTNLVQSFFIAFRELFDKLPNVNFAVKRSFNEFGIFDYFAVREYLGYDLFYQGKQTKQVAKIEIAARILPNNDFIQQEYKNTTTVKLLNQTTTSLGIQSRIDGIDGRFSILISKGTKVPFVNSGQYYTVSDNQTEISIETFKGDDDYTNNNFGSSVYLA